jgi:rod shape-determining protein MreC
METSRDDFIIAIRSAFLKKDTQQRFSLIALISFSIIFLILGSFNLKIINYLKTGIKEVVYRSSFIVSVPENYIKNNYIAGKKHFIMYEEYKANKKELEILRSKKLSSNFIISENKRLNKIIDSYFIKENETIAKIIIDKKSPFLKSIVINKGSNDKIKLGMIVLDNEYLVGKIIEVNYSTSRVLLLSDLNSKIPIIIEPNQIRAILSGTGDKKGVIQYTLKDYSLKGDAIVYTSGDAELFKVGIPVGKIKYNSQTLNDNVEFFSDFSQLKFVKVRSYKKFN